MALRYALINAFLEQGLNVTVALPADDITTWQRKCPAVHFVSFDAFSGTSIGIFNNLKTFFTIKKLIKEVRPNIIFLGNVKPNIYGGIAAYKCDIKNIYGLISGLGYAFIDEPGIKRAFVKKVCMFLYKLSFKNFTHVFFQNNDDRCFFIENRIVEENKSSVVPGTGVDLNLFSVKKIPEQLTFFMAARLIKEKGVFHFVEAAKYLKEKYNYVRFILGGNIDSNPSAITQTQLDEYSHFVEYIGYINDMPNVMPRCSVFIYPSYYREGVPRTLLEALACGRPVITTNNVGCRETVIDSVNGYKIDTKSTEALIKAIEKFILKPELIEKFGKESRKLAENKFDIHAVNQQIYAKIVSTSK